jgi:YbbR domain-containing protein
MVDSITDPVERKVFNNIPVEIINTELITNEGKVYEVLDGTDTVNVTAIGKSSVFDYVSRDDLKAVADLSELTFMNTVGIRVSSARNNSELEFRTNIDNVKLAIEKMDRDQKVINVSTSGEPASGYVVGGITPSQNVVRYSGPESLINQIDHIDAVININGYSSDINTTADLKIYDADNNEIKNSSIKLNITTVDVAVSILATKIVPLSFVVPDEPASGYVVNGEMLSVPETVVIAGRSGVLDGVSRIVVSDPALSVEDLTESKTAIVNIRKYLPTGVQFADSSFNGNVSVTIGIEPLVTKELKVPSRNFAAGNTPENLNVTLKEAKEQETYTIRISGTSAAVEAVQEESVIGVVDMDSLLQKLELTEWSAGVYQGDLTFNLPDTVTLEKPYQMTVVLEEIEQEPDAEMNNIDPGTNNNIE